MDAIMYRTPCKNTYPVVPDFWHVFFKNKIYYTGQHTFCYPKSSTYYWVYLGADSKKNGISFIQFHPYHPVSEIQHSLISAASS